jgi:hypothetical protein
LIWRRGVRLEAVWSVDRSEKAVARKNLTENKVKSSLRKKKVYILDEVTKIYFVLWWKKDGERKKRREEKDGEDTNFGDGVEDDFDFCFAKAT